MQKTARKNTKYSKNETILKIRHFAKIYIEHDAYSLCKMVNVDKIIRMLKTSKKTFQKSMKVVVRKKTLEKPPNIREMRQF